MLTKTSLINPTIITKFVTTFIVTLNKTFIKSFNTICKVLLIALCVFKTTFAFSSNNDFLGENSRWTLDAATRLTNNLDKNTYEFAHVVGLDIHKVLSYNKSNIGTLVFQPYLIKLNNAKSFPFFFDDGNDLQLNWRIANINFAILNQGKLNIKLGHFEIPFGLEYEIDTNGTLRQFTARDRGIKADWGATINGILPLLEYEIALTRGSGNNIESKGNPGIFSGRIGTPSNKNFITGLSWFTGDVLGGNGITKRQKLGVDLSYYYYQWQFMLESSVGKTANNNTINGLVETLWRDRTERFTSYLQLGYQRTALVKNNTSTKVTSSYWQAGVRWLSTNGFDLSAQYRHKLNPSKTIEVDPVFTLQLRYRM